MRSIILAVAVAVILSTGFAVVAEDEYKREAKIEFEKGVKHFDAEQYEEAAASFREANNLAPSWKILYNIGQCEAALKNYGEALETFEQYLAKGGDEIAEDRQTEVRTELERLRDMVGTVEIKGRDGDEITVNDKVRGTLPAAARLKVAMGDVKVSIKRNGRPVHDKTFKISAGELVKLDAATGELTTESPDKTPTGEEPIIGGHLIRVITSPPQKGVALDGKGGWHRAPHSFSAAPGGHSMEVRGGFGYRNKQFSVLIEDSDLNVDLKLDRPIFQAGIIMTAAGGALAILGAIWLATIPPENMTADNYEFADSVGLVGLGSVSLIGGIFMMIFDRQRDTIVNITPAAPKPSGAEQSL